MSGMKTTMRFLWLSPSVIRQPEKLLMGGSSFAYQNALFETLFGEAGGVYKMVDVTEVSRSDQGVSWETVASAAEEGYAGAPAYVEIDAADLYDTGRFYSGFDLLIDGAVVPGKYLWCFSDGIVAAGNVTEGKNVTLLGSELQADDSLTCRIAVVDTALLADLQQQARAKAFTCDVWRDGYVSGSYRADAEDAYLFASIPYDAGWTVRVNGEEVMPETVADALMAIPLTEGDNAIEMSYLSPGVKTGGMISAVAWVAFVALLIVRRVRAKSVR